MAAFSVRGGSPRRPCRSGSGISTPSFNNAAAGFRFVSSISILGAAVGGIPSQQGDNFGICWACAASFKFSKNGGGGPAAQHQRCGR